VRLDVGMQDTFVLSAREFARARRRYDGPMVLSPC
jgi:hypothetical protein